jgi:hypothetical protein
MAFLYRQSEVPGSILAAYEVCNLTVCGSLHSVDTLSGGAPMLRAFRLGTIISLAVSGMIAEDDAV